MADDTTSPVQHALTLTGDGHAVAPEFNASFARGMTLQAMVFLDDLRERATIFAAGERPDVMAIRLAVLAGTGDLWLEVADHPSAVCTLCAARALAPGRWTHVSAVIDERSVARLFVDGVERARVEKFPVPAAGSRPLGFLGRDLTRPDETLHGRLAEVRLWSRDLSRDEIEASRGRRLTGDEPELAAYWPLDHLADGRLPDRSGHGRSLRPVGAALTAAPDLPLAQGPAPAPALALRGGASITARNDLSRTSAALTVQAQVRVARFEAGTSLITLGDGPDPLLSLGVVRPDGTLGLRVAAAGLVLAALEARPLAPGAWTHLCVLLDPDQVTLFVDGQQVASARLAWPQRRPVSGYMWKTLTIGAVGKLQAADADVAEVRLFTTALSRRQIARSVRRTMLGTEAGLAVLWRLDEGRGAVARNAGLLGSDRALREGSACDGTIAGGTWIERSGLTRARAADARPTRALALDGTGSHVLAPGFPRGPGEGYTVEAWVRLRNFTGSGIVELDDPRQPEGAPPRLALRNLGGTPDLQLVVAGGPADAPVLRALGAPGVFAADRWTHVAAAVFSSGLVVLVVDGQKVAERPLFTPAEVAADTGDARGRLRLGRTRGASQRLDGGLAEVRLWSRALTASELRDRRFLRAAGHEHRLARCYHLDEPGGDRVADAATPGVHGTIAPGGALRERPDLPLWPTDERAGAGVDAVCTLMQDPRIVRSGAQRRVEHVTTYEIVLSARTARGTIDARCTFELVADERVTIRHDRGDGVDLTLEPGRPATLVASASGKARLTFDALGRDEADVLRCPIFKVRTAAMPAGQWEVIAPDRQAHEVLGLVTGESLQGGQPEALGRGATRSPFTHAIPRADADELAATVRALVGAAGRASVTAESASPLSFAAGDDDATTVSGTLSRGAEARVDRHDAPIARPILPRRLPVPDDLTPSFAAGEQDEILEVALLAAAGPAPDDGDMVSFGGAGGGSQLAGSRKLRDELRRFSEDAERAFAAAGKRLAEAADKLVAKARELADDLARLVKSSTLKEAGECLRDLLGDVRDAFVVTVRTLDPSGYVLETIQVIADVGGKLVRTVVDSVQTALGAIRAFFNRVGAKLQDVAQFVARLFRWDDILETADGLLGLQKAALARFPASLRALRLTWNEVLGRLETQATRGIDVAIERLGIADPPPETPPDERTSFILDKLENNLDAGLFRVDVADTFREPLARIWNSLDVAGLLRDLKAGLRTIDVEAMFSSPGAFVRGGLSALLLLLKALVQLVLRGVKIAGTVMLELAEAAFVLLERLADARISIPWVTEFVETTILRGRTLTLLTLISVVAAVPYTVAYKLVRGEDEGPFSGPASFAAPTDDPEAQAKAALDALTRDGAGTAAATPRKDAWNADAAAFVSVIGSFVCGLITAVADFVDNDKTAVRAVKLVNAAILAVIAGISGFPTGEDSTSKRLAIAGWVFGVLGSVLALVDGVNGILAVKDTSAEDRAEVLTYISGVYSLLTTALGIAFTISDTATNDKKLTDEAPEWLAMVSGIMGGVVGAIPMVPDEDDTKIMAAKFGASSVFLVAQVTTGLAGACVALKASQAEATA